MSNAVLSLEELAQHIHQQKTNLADLRQEYKARQAQLADLARKKRELLNQLRKVESAIEAVATTPALPAVQSKSAPAAKVGRGLSLPKLLVDIVRKAKRPLAAEELAEAVVSRKYPTTSTNLQAMIETRAGELARKGILKRSTDKKGFELGKATLGTSGSATKAPVTKAAKAPGSKEKRKSLGVVITEVLAQSPTPLTTEELARRVLATGYKTTSQNFQNVLWVGIGNLDTVERVADGYRLKKGKATVNKKKG